MNIEREIKVRDAIKYCIENFDSQTATNRIVEFWKDELKLQEQQCNIANVSKSLTPNRCSVCNGSGSVPNGFYIQTSGHWSINSNAPETCRTCDGTGITIAT